MVGMPCMLQLAGVLVLYGMQAVPAYALSLTLGHEQVSKGHSGSFPAHLQSSRGTVAFS